MTRHAYGLETSFEAISGSGGPLVNFNAEYDALPDIGHACGHNLIATSSVTAFLALSFALRKFGIPGRTQLLGTPAEENGGGKAQLIDAGAYRGVDVSLMAFVSSMSTTVLFLASSTNQTVTPVRNISSLTSTKLELPEL